MSDIEQSNTSESDVAADVGMEEFLAAFDSSEAREDSGDDGDGGAEEHSQAKAKTKPTDLNALAETLAVEVKDLYDLKIPSAVKGQEPYTLGKLKDLAKAQDDFTLRSIEADIRIRDKEAALIAREQQLDLLAESLPASAMKPEALAKLQERIRAKAQAERGKTLEAIPEWSDETVRTAELKGIAEQLKSYGIAETFLLKHFDSGLVRYLRDNYVRDQRMRKALETARLKKPKQQSKAGPVDKQRRPAARRASGEDARVEEFLNHFR